MPSLAGIWQPGTTRGCMATLPSGFFSPISTRHMRQLATTVRAGCQQYEGTKTPPRWAAWIRLSRSLPMSTGLPLTCTTAMLPNAPPYFRGWALGKVLN